MRGNPYPGPQAFDAESAKSFYGRRKELRILAGLAEARRASLLFSASGAGKSSLIHAGLLPALTETRATGRGSRRRGYQRMYLVGSASVGGGTRGVAAENTYVYLALQSLRPDFDPRKLARQHLAEGLAPLLRLEHGTPGLLVIDQFEELFTRNVDHWPERTGFFEQVREALDRHPDLHVLFSMREEYIAELTPFAGLLPERLQSRFRLERLGREAALEAVTRPAADAGCPFADAEVAGELVDNLLGGGGGDGGGATPVAGEFVEPVHLQIVCRQLWQGLAEGSTAIRREDLVASADVDEALRAFYEAGLRRALEASGGRVRENALRDWFDQTDLVTPSRTRGLVLCGAETTGGLANEAVDLLVDAYLVRHVRRGSDTWFELAHDRLVEPILAANAEWRRAHLKPVTVAAEAWSAADEDPRRLWSGRQLEQVARDARARPGEYSGAERRFVHASAAAVRRRRLAWVLLAAVALGSSALVFVSLKNRQEAREQAVLARKMKYVSGIRLARRQIESGRWVEAEETLREETPESRRDWEWGLLLAQSHSWEFGAGEDDLVDAAFGPVDPPRIAAASAAGKVTLWDARSGDALFELKACAPREEGIKVDLRFSGDGRSILTLCPAGPAVLWDTGTGARLAEIDWTNRDTKLVGVEDGRALALRDGVAETWQWDAGEARRRLTLAAEGGVSAAAFCGGGGSLVTGSASGRIRLWDGATGAARAGRAAHATKIRVLACSADGQWLISADARTSRIWRLADRVGFRAEPWPVLPQDRRLRHAAFAADGRRIVTGYTHQMMVWSAPDTEDGKWKQATLARRVDRATFSPDSRRVLAESGGSAILWDWESGATREFRGPQDDAVKAAFSPDGTRLLTRFPGQQVVRVWDVGGSSRRTRWDFDGHGEIIAAELTAARVRVIDSGGTVRVREAGAAERVTELPGHLSSVAAAAFSADGWKLVTASEDVTQVWMADDSQPGGWAVDFQLPSVSKVGWVAFSADGGRLVAVSDETGTATVWDAAAGAESPLATASCGGYQVLAAAFCPSGGRLATTCADGTARIRDLASGEGPPALTGHDGGVSFAAFSPDGRWLVTTGKDWTARLWSAANGAEGPVLAGHEGEVSWADFSPDGRRVLTASRADGSVRLWDLEGNELAALHGFEGLRSARFVATEDIRGLLAVSHRRVELLNVFPFRPEHLPGDPSVSFGERFRLFEDEIR